VPNLFSFIFSIPHYIGIIFLISYLIYFGILFISNFFPIQNIKKKYQTDWALVTGGSSGIGYQIVDYLAKQNLNVVVAALSDNFLKNSEKDFTTKYPNLKFKFVGVDFSKEDFMDILLKETDDLDIGIVFNNAGYIAIKPFDSVNMETHLKHLNCNMISHVKITHHFYSKLVSKKKKKCNLFYLFFCCLFTCCL